MTMMPNRRCFAGHADAAMDPIVMRRDAARRPLACEWRRNPEGRLVCGWRHVDPGEAGASGGPGWLDALAVPGDGDPLLPRRASDDAILPSTRRSRVLSVAQSIAIGLLFAAAGLETLVCILADAGGLF
jgi:hypothetical protein